MIHSRRIAFVLFLALILAGGCTTRRNPSSVSGKVTYKGEPVTAGNVTFHQKEGGIYFYALNSDGTFAGSDLPAEEMAVTIDTEVANPEGHPNRQKNTEKMKEVSKGYSEMMKQKGMVPEGAGVQGKYTPIPKKYWDKDKSPLHVTLKKGSNTFDFNLDDNP